MKGLRYPIGVLDDVRPVWREAPISPQGPIDKQTVRRVLAAVVETHYCMFGSGFAPGVAINDACPVSAIDEVRLNNVCIRLERRRR